MGLNSIVYIGMRQVDSVDNTKFSSEHDCRTDTIVNQDLIFPNYMTYSQSSSLSECTYKFLANQCGCIEPRVYTPIMSINFTISFCIARVHRASPSSFTHSTSEYLVITAD